MAAYHVLPVPAKLSYEQYVSLVLNTERVRMQTSISVAHGSAAANSRADLPRLFADAMALDGSEVNELEFQMNAARREARMQQARSRQAAFEG